MTPDISTATYQSPGLLYILCTFSAMAFVISAFRWFLKVRKSANNGEVFHQSYTVFVWRGQLLNLLFVMVVSIAFGAYDYFKYGSMPDLVGEFVFLGVFIAYLFYYARKKNRMDLMYSSIFEIFWLGFLCIAGWAVTIAIGFALDTLFKMSVVINSNDTDFLVIFIPGFALECAPFVNVSKMFKIC